MDPNSTREGVAPAWADCLARPAAEVTTTALHLIEGNIPPGLRGTLYGNGPARLERGGIRVFDRHSLKPLARGETEPWFQWHFGA